MIGSRFLTLVLAIAVSLAASALSAQQRITLPARDRALTLPTRTLFQVGELEGEDYETFASITDVAFDGSGNLYVLDATAHRVVAFDPQGRHLRTFGKQGEGPGEFGFPTALAVLPDGSLVVNDAARASLQVFRPDGTFLRTVVLDEELGRAAGRMRPSGENSLITETLQLQRMVNPAGPVQAPPRSVTRLTIGERASGHRLFNAPPRDLRLVAPKASAEGVELSMSITGFEPALLWTPVGDGGVAALNTAGYQINLIDAQGRLRHSLERPFQPRQVTRADRRRFLEKQQARMAGGGGGVAMIAVAARDGSGGGATSLRLGAIDIKESDVTWSDVVPVITGLGTDSFGRLWVQRSVPDQGDGPIDIIDAGRSYLGTLSHQALPRAFGPGGRLAYIIEDDLDVQRVVVKQLLR